MDDSSKRTIETRLGPINAIAQNGLSYAYGVRYGTAKRFQEPEPVAAWSEPLDCTKPAPLCPQLPFAFDFILGPIDTDRPKAEDCLTASVIAPLTAGKEAKLPVIFWIHGGANISGGADLEVFDVSQMAERGAVVVSIQYRLGIFGAFPIEGVAPANLGLMDQILALKWVHANIDSFGGDPSRITIMGQSAGAAAVYSILISPSADGLYDKALLISVPLGAPRASYEYRRKLSDKAKQAMGASPSTLSTEELLRVQEAVVAEARKQGDAFSPFTPVIGQSPLPAEDMVQDRLSKIAGRVELLTGWGADDCLPFVYMIPWGRRLLSIPIIGRWLFVGVGKVATGVVFKTKSIYIHKSILAAGGKSTTFSVEWFPRGGKWRACHCIEMPLMFGDWELWADRPLVQGSDESEAGKAAVKKVVERLGDEVKDLFVGFASGTLHPQPGHHLSIDADFVLSKL